MGGWGARTETCSLIFHFAVLNSCMEDLLIRGSYHADVPLHSLCEDVVEAGDYVPGHCFSSFGFSAFLKMSCSSPRDKISAQAFRNLFLVRCYGQRHSTCRFLEQVLKFVV